MPKKPLPLTTSLPQIAEFAQVISTRIHGGTTLALIGPLGSGKTTFTQHLLQALGYTGSVSSPTFVLMQEYKIPKQSLHIEHFDLYRLESETEIVQSGLTEHWGSPETVSIIEWADKAKGLLPENTIYIHFTS